MCLPSDLLEQGISKLSSNFSALESVSCLICARAMSQLFWGVFNVFMGGKHNPDDNRHRK